jgi:hypothetical protein
MSSKQTSLSGSSLVAVFWHQQANADSLEECSIKRGLLQLIPSYKVPGSDFRIKKNNKETLKILYEKQETTKKQQGEMKRSRSASSRNKGCCSSLLLPFSLPHLLQVP